MACALSSVMNLSFNANKVMGPRGGGREDEKKKKKKKKVVENLLLCQSHINKDMHS